MDDADHFQACFAVSETSAPKRGLSPLNNRLLTVLLATLLAMFVMGVAVIVLTIGIRTYDSTPPHHSMGMLVTSSLAGKHDALSLRSNEPVAFPAQPVAAARDLVHLVGGAQPPCYTNNIHEFYPVRLGCPVTSPFRRYLLAHMRDIDPICQCQNYPIRSSFHLLFQRAGLATVVATLTFYYNTVYIVFVEVNEGKGWLVTANYVTHS